MRTSRNALPDLISLDTWLRPKGKRHELLVDLRADKAEFDAEGLSIEVSAREAIIDASFDGFEFAPVARLGEPQAEKKLLASRTVEHELVLTGGLAAKASESGIAAAEINAGASGKVKATSKAKSEDTHLPVRALPGGRWRVSEPHQEPLASTFLQGGALCVVDSLDRANRRASTVRVTIKQKDLSIKKQGSMIENITTNTSRLMQILLAKSLHDESDGPFKGKVIFCKSEVEIEDTVDEP